MGTWSLEMRGYKGEGGSEKLKGNFRNWGSSEVGKEL